MKREQLKALIRESIKDQLSQLKEKAQNNRMMQAESIIAILQEEADALGKLAEHANSLFTETEYSELSKEKGVLEQLQQQKLAKIQSIKERFGIKEKKDKKKKPAAKKAAEKKKSPAAQAAKTAKGPLDMKEAAKGKGSIASVKSQVKKANKK